MDVKPPMHEDLYHRQLWSAAFHYGALHWSEGSGLLAYMTKTTVQVQYPQFEYMNSFTAGWISIEKSEERSGIAAFNPSENKVGSLTDWLHRNSLKEALSIQACEWCKVATDVLNRHPLLAVLLTDGSLLLLEVMSGTASIPDGTINTTGKNTYPLRNGFRAQLHRLSIEFDCSTAWHDYYSSRKNVRDQRIRCFAEHNMAGVQGTVLVLASADSVTVWRYRSDGSGESDGSTPSLQLLSECSVAGIGASEAITSLLVVEPERTTAAARAFFVVASTSAGDIIVLQFNASLAAGAGAGTLSLQGSEVRRVRVCDTPVMSLQLLKCTGSDSSGGSGGNAGAVVCAVSGAKMHTVPVAALLSGSAPASAGTTLHRSNVVAVVSLPAVHSGQGSAVRAVTASTAGELGSWAAASDHPSSFWSAHQPPLHCRSNDYPVLGLAADSTGLMVGYLYKTAAQHINSREVQLNHNLRLPRCAVAWELSPFVEENFACSVKELAQVLLHIVSASRESDRNGAGVRSLTSLPLAYLRSLESDAVRKHFRSLIPDLQIDDPVTGDGKGEGEGEGQQSDSSSSSGGESDGAEEGGEGGEGIRAGDGGNGYLTSDSEEGVGMLGSPAAAARSTAANRADRSRGSAAAAPAVKAEAKRKFNNPLPAGGRSKRRSNLEAVYRRLQQMDRPTKGELVQLAVPVLFDAAVLAVLALSAATVGANAESREGPEGLVGLEAEVMRMDMDDKIAALFAIPAEPHPQALLDRAVVWRCLHVLLLACHSVRGVPGLGADWQPIPASLRQTLHTAHYIAALHRYTAGAAAGPPESAVDAQSVYFMSLVVRDYAERASPPLAAQLTALVTAAQTAIAAILRRSGQPVSADRDLHESLGVEMCDICGGQVPFQPCSDDNYDTSAEVPAPSGLSSAAAYAQARRRLRGSCVLYGTCTSCGVRAERCCFSLRVITTPPSACGARYSGLAVPQLRQAGRLYGCTVCSAVTTPALAATVSEPQSRLGSTGQAQGEGALLCPYCAVLMLPK